MEVPIDRRPSSASSTGPINATPGELKAPNGRRRSKSNSLKPNDSSNNSISSNDGSGIESYDGVFDKTKSRSSEEGQHRSSGEKRRRMSNLFKGRRRRRKSSATADGSQYDPDEDVPPLPDTSMLRMDQPSPSEESLGMHRSVASSLVTEESDPDVPPVRPTISPHDSHSGYLTTSSPLITSETVDSPPVTATRPDSAQTSSGDLAQKHANTLDVGSSVKRSPSPVGRLKEAFQPTRRSTSPKTGGELDSSRPASGSGGLGGFLGGVGKKPGSRGGSKVLDNSRSIHASPPQLHTSDETQSTPTLPSSRPKNIVTTVPATPPNLVETPQTLVTPPTPTDTKSPSPPTSAVNEKFASKQQPSQSNPNIVTSPSGNMISHRRARSATNPPSKLSNSISAPLTPTLEETKTPGGSLVSPQGSGFFSSVFSAAQNAATQLSSTIANTNLTSGPKGKGSKENTEEKTGAAGGEEVIGPESADTSNDNPGTEKRQLAVETLGSGNLSLAHLGISESSDPSPMSSAVNLSGDQAAAKAEDVAAAQAVSAAYAGEKSPVLTAVDRPRSLTTISGISGNASPPRLPNETDSPGTLGRTGSIRSRISGGRKRRHRGSSATTGNTVAAAIGASTTMLANPAAMNGSSRLNGTGFAVASPKRNRDFHSLFKSVPEDDYLIEDYSAALQKEILLHGRLYVSEGHLCFSSNILGWVTNLVISFDEVVSVEKKSTAVVFPNAIVIQTLHARNIFASFLSRDSTYDLIIGIWKISHPNLKSSLNGVALDGSGTGDKTEKAESVGSDEVSIQDTDDEVYDEDAEEEEGLGSFTEAGEGSVAGSEAESVKAEVRKVSAQAAGAPVNGGSAKAIDNVDAAVNGAAVTQDYPGPHTHGTTDCGDGDSHYDKLLIDTTIPAPLGKIYSLAWGPASGVFMRRWLVDDQKSTELTLEDDKQGLGENKKAMSFSYTKPLGGSIGPKQTKCNINATMEQFDLDKAVTVLCSTQTPDVPSGNIFLVKTRYCMMWAPNNSTRLIMTSAIEWSGKSWLKGPIEKGASDGQLSYAKDIAAALRAAVSTKPLKATPKTRAGKKGKKSAPTDDLAAAVSGSDRVSDAASKKKPTNWGILEPIHGPLRPLLDVFESNSAAVITVLLIMVFWLWFRSPAYGTHSHGALGIPGMPTPQRIAAYEEIWRAEESELWKWLEDRVSMDRVSGSGGGDATWQKKQRARDMEAKLKDKEIVGGMSDRQVDEAIRVTQERLEALKEAVGRKKRST